MAAFRRLLPLLLLAVLLGAVACNSDANKAFDDHGRPSADTGPVAQETTGGDAAGSYNWNKMREGNAEHAKDEHAVENPTGH